jgi:D-threo-aldose 1-dehydrogenase
LRLIAAALQFPLRHPAVVSVIPGGQSPDQVRSNLAILDTAVPPGLWADQKTGGCSAPTPRPPDQAAGSFTR